VGKWLDLFPCPTSSRLKHSLLLLHYLHTGFWTDICPVDVSESLPLSPTEADDLSVRKYRLLFSSYVFPLNRG